MTNQTNPLVGVTVILTLDDGTEVPVTVTKISRGWYTLVSEKGTEYKKRRADFHYESEEVSLEDALAEAGEEPMESDEPEVADMATQLRKYASNYKRRGKSLDCDDPVARELAALGGDLEAIYKLAAKEMGVTIKSLKERYSHLNLGQQRMNLGNRIRYVRKQAEEG